ncbi:hypothetical protein KUF71_025310, partial [Frankliniella fusca]
MASACLDCLAFPCQWVTLSNPGLSNLRALSGIEFDTIDPRWRPSCSIRQPGTREVCVLVFISLWTLSQSVYVYYNDLVVFQIFDSGVTVIQYVEYHVRPFPS